MITRIDVTFQWLSQFFSPLNEWLRSIHFVIVNNSLIFDHLFALCYFVCWVWMAEVDHCTITRSAFHWLGHLEAIVQIFAHCREKVECATIFTFKSPHDNSCPAIEVLSSHLSNDSWISVLLFSLTFANKNTHAKIESLHYFSSTQVSYFCNSYPFSFRSFLSQRLITRISLMNIHENSYANYYWQFVWKWQSLMYLILFAAQINSRPCSTDIS